MRRLRSPRFALAPASRLSVRCITCRRDWPAGAMLVAIGGLVAAALTGKNGPLVIAFVAMTSWSCGRFDAWQWREIHWSFLLLFVPGFLLALGRENRLLAHAAILALSVWLATLLVPQAGGKYFFSLIDGGLAFSAAYIAIGLLALDRGWPAVIPGASAMGMPGFSEYCSALKSFSFWKSRASPRMPSILISIWPMARRWSRWRRSRCWRRKETTAGSSSSRLVPSV